MSTKQIKLQSAVESYIQHLQDKNQKPSTVGTARRTLALLVAEMGEKKEVAKILPVHVSKFFNSEAATMLRGKPRAMPSILQIRRIVRAALVFWHEQGWVASVPLPATERHFLESKEKEGKKGKKGKNKKDQPKKAKASKPKRQRKEAEEAKPEPNPEEEADTATADAPAIQIVRETKDDSDNTTATKEG